MKAFFAAVLAGLLATAAWGLRASSEGNVEGTWHHWTYRPDHRWTPKPYGPEPKKELYFVFALEKCNESSPWTIHGLWPQYSEKDWPSDCTKEAFNQSAIADLMPEINQYWSTCPNDHHSETWFLTHEWTKHGTCAPSNWTQHYYFKTALEVYMSGSWRAECDRQVSQYGKLSCKVPYHNLTNTLA